MPAGIVKTPETSVKNICDSNTPARTYERISIDDLLDGLRVVIKYILSRKRLKTKLKSLFVVILIYDQNIYLHISIDEKSQDIYI